MQTTRKRKITGAPVVLAEFLVWCNHTAGHSHRLRALVIDYQRITLTTHEIDSGWQCCVGISNRNPERALGVKVMPDGIATDHK